MQRSRPLVVSFLAAGLSLFCTHRAFTQYSDWMNYWPTVPAFAIVVEQDSIWVGTSMGVVKLNKVSGQRTFYNTTNSGLPGNSVTSMALEGNGRKWIGTSTGGVVSFDGVNWTVFDSSNSALPENNITAVAVEGNGT